MIHEANVSAQQSQAEENSRFSETDENTRGTQRPQAPPSEGTQTPGSLSTRRLAAFPSLFRIRHRREFLAVYECGRRVSGANFVLFVQDRGGGEPRLGLTATRKVGKAAVRNRQRRLLREVFRRLRPLLGSWDIVINIRASSVGMSYRQVEEEFLSLVQRARRALNRPPPPPC